MATAAFRSTTKRSSIGRAGQDTASSAARRRSRSLSRGPSRFPPSPPEPSEIPTPRGKFVNKARGSGFPEISLDDLADEYFRSKFEDEITPPDRRSSRRMSEISPRMENGEINRQRGRSVSRRGVDGKAFANGKKEEGFLENSAPRRRQRSLSVARHRCSDSEVVLSSSSVESEQSCCFGCRASCYSSCRFIFHYLDKMPAFFFSWMIDMLFCVLERLFIFYFFLSWLDGLAL